MTSPIEHAMASVPFWMKEIQSCNGIEVHPVRDADWNEEEQGKRPFSSADDNETWCEPYRPEDAHFWSVYGHLKEGGMVCFEDFPTEAEARSFAATLYHVYPGVSKNAILDLNLLPGFWT